MWKLDGHLIQVECGGTVIAKYTSKDQRCVFGKVLGEKAPEEGGLLTEKTGELRKKLTGQGVYLPSVGYTDSNEMKNSLYRIYFGLECFTFDMKECPLMDTIGQIATGWQIPEITEEYVQSLFQASLECIDRKDYNKAALLSSRTYYWAVLLNMSEIAINSVINLGSICQINNNIQSAYTYGKKAVLMAEDASNNNPYLKYYAHCYLANMSWLARRGADAVKLFYKALEDIQFLNEPELKAQVMWNIAVADIELQDYERAIATLERLYSLVDANGLYTEEISKRLHEYYARACKREIAQLRKSNVEIDRLMQKSIQKKDSGVKKFVIQIAVECFGMVVKEAFGNLCGFEHSSSVNISVIISKIMNSGTAGNITTINDGTMSANFRGAI